MRLTHMEKVSMAQDGILEGCHGRGQEEEKDKDG